MKKLLLILPLFAMVFLAGCRKEAVTPTDDMMLEDEVIYEDDELMEDEELLEPEDEAMMEDEILLEEDAMEVAE